MGKRKSQEEVAAIFNSKDCELLSIYKTNREKVDYRCNKGHRHSIRLDSFMRNKGNGCPQCAKENKQLDFDFVKSEINKSNYRYVSGKYNNAHSKLKVECKNCGTKTYITWNNFKTGKRCQICYWESNKAENHVNYNPTLSDSDRVKLAKLRHYKHPKYSSWVRSVKRNACCVKCGSCEKLEAHHVQSYATNPELVIDINNGVALCHDCHVKFHKQYGRTGNTKEQLDEFLVSPSN